MMTQLQVHNIMELLVVVVAVMVVVVVVVVVVVKFDIPFITS